MQEPKRNASRSTWRKFIEDEFDPEDLPEDLADMSRAELIEWYDDELDAQADDGEDGYDDEGDVDDVVDAEVLTAEEDRDEDEAVEKFRDQLDRPTLDDVPEDLRVTTDTGERRDVERVATALDGIPFWLYRPSDSAMYLWGSRILSDNDSERLNAMMQLVQLSLEPAGRDYLFSKINDPQNSFEDGAIGELVARILTEWAEDAAVDKFRQAQATNRAARRQAKRERGDRGSKSRRSEQRRSRRRNR